MLMLLAHTQLRIDVPSKALTFLGSFAPILFFAVSGITAHFQARKHPPLGVVIWLLPGDAQEIWGSYLVWPAVALTSLMLMWILPILLGALRIPSFMSYFPAWIGLLAMILAAPLVLPSGVPLVMTELVLGLILALYYPSMTHALKAIGRRSSQPIVRGSRHGTEASRLDR